ncbi:MAG TPA: hypothetical protein V6C65_04660 [Allocoleopsis sp.]
MSLGQVCDRLGRGKNAVLRYIQDYPEGLRLPAYRHEYLGYMILRSDLEWFEREVFPTIDSRGGRPGGGVVGVRQKRKSGASHEDVQCVG